MTPRAVTSLARICVLVVLVLSATWGGSSVVSVMNAPQAPATVVVSPTPAEVAILSPTPTAAVVPTATQPAAAPTVAPTVAPTPKPTAAPTGRSTFAVPENTTGASIVVERGPVDTRTVALTFDAGEGRGYTEEILDLLKAEGIRASFGSTGAWARENPDLILRILDEGHLLFNHSESHKSWTGVSPGTEPLTDEQRTAEVMGAHEAVLEVANHDMAPFWRPPYGDYDAQGQVLLASLGYDYTFWWTCDSLGWNGYSAQEIAEWCGPNTANGGPGAIILYHVSQEQDYLSLEQTIAQYRAEGYEFVTLNEMIVD
jgi:peptidoglycan/xylan/chitin deacetylase (PgdA/CDA1 family)